MIQGIGDAAEKRNEPPPSKIEALDGSNYEEWSGRMRSAFKRYKLLKLAMGEEKTPEEGDARDRWIEKSAVQYDLILQSVNNDIFQHIKDLVERTSAGATWVVVLPKKLLRGMELQEAAEEEGEGKAEAVGEALAEGEAEVTVTRGMGALVAGGVPKMEGACCGTGPAKAPLALVHMDVVGPTRAPSLSGSRYLLIIVDDHTHAVWVYPLKTKGEVAAAVLKEWMLRAQRESGHKVKVIRTDNGEEFIGTDFEAVLKKKGMQHQLTVPYNPQQNGVAERFNRTLQEGARTLLGRVGLPDPFGVTALWQVALVKNRVLATVGDKQWVPYTKWYGSAPAVNMLQAYGYMVVFHVPKEKRGKLEASGRWGVHLGLAKDHKGWLIWDLTSQQLTVSRDVQFLESLYYMEWKQQQQKLPTTPLIIEADEVQQPSRQVQAPRAWYHKLEETLLAGGFKKSKCDHSLFLLQEKEQFLMLLVDVDDILLFSESAAMIERVEEMLEMQFKCSKMGDVKYYFRMHVERDLDKGVLRLHQRK
ncbi:unnamed protein product [Closterium sp. NIES-54]